MKQGLYYTYTEIFSEKCSIVLYKESKKNN